MPWTRDEMAARAAQELQDGYYVNLGIGIPTLVANHIPPGVEVTLQSENGMLGIGPFPFEDEIDPDLINAGKQTISELPSSSYFSSSDSFAMIRGVVMDHCAKDGSPKFIPECTLPLTGTNVVDMIITDLCVFRRDDHDSPFKLIELAPGISAEDVAAKTTAAYEIAL